MGQYFKVVDFDLLQGLYSMGKLGENVTNPFETVVRMICEVDIPPSPVAAIKAPRRLTSGSHDPLTSVSFHHLPQELIVMVFERTETYYDALFFALTCSAVWRAGEHTLRERYTDIMSPARGHRLISIGDYAEDLPEDLSTPSHVSRLIGALGRTLDEWNRIPERYFTREGGDGPDAYTDADADADADESDVRPPVPAEEALPTAIKRLCEYAYYKTPDADRLVGLHMGELGPYSRAGRHRSWDITSVLYEVNFIPNAWRWFSPDWLHVRSEGVMVLRNLSKKAYVRSDTFSIDGSDPVWGFGRALVFRISWSTDSSCNMAYEGLTRGVWAGDRFDVVKLSTFQADAGEDDWSDVTQEVKDEMIAIAKSDFGEDWHIEAAW